jgi:hypothetical protein
MGNKKGIPENWYTPFKDIASKGVWFFQNLYKEKEGCPIQEIMEFISTFFQFSQRYEQSIGSRGILNQK